jgi:hypothetical protein
LTRNVNFSPGGSDRFGKTKEKERKEVPTMRRIIQKHITTIQITSVEIMWDEDDGPVKKPSAESSVFPIRTTDSKPSTSRKKMPALPPGERLQDNMDENIIDGFAIDAEAANSCDNIITIQE